MCMCAGYFLTPVSLVEYPDYLRFVSTPMDLSTMWRKLNSSPTDGTGYKTLGTFRADMELIATNCEAYCRDRFPSMPPVRPLSVVVVPLHAHLRSVAPRVLLWFVLLWLWL